MCNRGSIPQQRAFPPHQLFPLLLSVPCPQSKVAHRLLEFFPPQRRSQDEFSKHFTVSGGAAEGNVRRGGAVE